MQAVRIERVNGQVVGVAPGLPPMPITWALLARTWEAPSPRLVATREGGERLLLIHLDRTCGEVIAAHDEDTGEWLTGAELAAEADPVSLAKVVDELAFQRATEEA